jgi:hypothetical protein
MKYYLWLLIWGIVGMSTAFAQSSPTISQEQIPQKAYCEEGHASYMTYSGIYVNPDGKLYRFGFKINDKQHVDIGSPGLPSTATKALTNTNLTEKNMEDYYSQARVFVRQIPMDEWQSMVKLLTEASNGMMSAPISGR